MSGVLATFLVLAVELDGGLLAIADRRITLGEDVCHPALASMGALAADGVAVGIERQALPPWARSEWWVNREAMVLECATTDESIYDGTVRFDGIIAAQPDETAGLWSVSLVPPRRRVRQVPDYGIVTATDWPLAADSAMGAAKPMIVGTVDSCPLLVVQVQPWTTLTAAALPDTTQLEVADATAFAAAGSVVVDGATYTYTGKADNLLLGMSIPRGHAAGTLVAQSGSNVYLAAGHAVTAIDDIRADGALASGGTVDLSAATVTFAAPPAVVSGATRYTLDEHFDAIAAGNTASNAANAIRAALNTYTQGGTPSGTVTAAAPGTIGFSRPADGNRIISGAYAVQFSVAVGVQVGWARVRIGNDIVWSYDPGGGVLYNWSPCAITLDDDADTLPVSVEVEQGGSADQVTVTIITASRVVVTGNLDEANYATVAPGQALKVTQSDTPPDRGRIAKVRLVVRWFATDAAIGTTLVKFGGVPLGKLSLTPNSGTSINKTVTVNSVTQGAASLPQTAVTTSATKTDSAISTAINAMVNYTTYRIDPASTSHLLLFPVDVYIALPANVVAGTYTFTMQLQANAGAPGSYADSYFYLGDTSQYIYTGTPGTLTFSIALVEGQASLRVRHVVSQVTPALPLQSYYHPTIKHISGNVNCRPTLNAISVAASSSPIAAAALSNSGIDVSLTNNAIQLTVPAPPRVVNTVFDLPTYTRWIDVAGKTAEISLTGTGASLCVVETYLQVEFDEITYVAAETLTATVTGLSGNPADVLGLLAEASDEPVQVAPLVRLYDWAEANALAFARRLSDSTDALTLLQYAADQAGVFLARAPDGLAPVRWTDTAGQVTVITDADLLEPARIGWADRVENDITLRYAEDYAGGAGFTRVQQAGDPGTLACRQSVAALRETRPVQIDGGWLRADTAATVALGQHVSRYALPRRVLSLDLPFAFELEQGGLIEYAEAVWRITDCNTDGGWVQAAAEELPA